MRSFINLVTAFSFLAIASAATLPLAAVYSGKDSILNVLNHFVIAQAFSVFLDSNTIIRTQVAFAKDDPRLARLAFGFASRSLSMAPVALCIGAIELWLFGFSFFVAIGARHIQNYFRICVPQLREFEKFSFISNIIASVRNLGLFVAIIVFEPKNFAYLLVLILLLEWVCLPLYFARGQTKLTLHRRPYAILINAARHAATSFLRSWSAKTPIMNSMRSTVDRIIVALVFTEPAEILYLKFKAAFQFVDAFVGVFSYQIHLELIKTKTVGPLNRYWKIGFLAFGVGVVSLLLLLDAQPSGPQLLLWCGLALVASFKRVSDSVAGSFLVANSQFRTLVLLYGLESLLVIFILLAGLDLFNVDGAGAFFLFTATTTLASLLFVAASIRYAKVRKK
jgi:hypothetical protein